MLRAGSHRYIGIDIFISLTFWGLSNRWYVCFGNGHATFIYCRISFGKDDKVHVFEKESIQFSILGKERTVIVSNLIASIIFFLTGILIIYLKSIGRLGMEDTEGFTKMITNASGYVNPICGREHVA